MGIFCPKNFLVHGMHKQFRSHIYFSLPGTYPFGIKKGVRLKNKHPQTHAQSNDEWQKVAYL